MSIRILIADDHKIVRDGLSSLLAQQPEMEVVGQAGDGRTAVRMAAELSVQVAVIDIGMPDLNGIEATRQIKAQDPGVKVIALSMHAGRRFVTEMFRAGASGYLLKECAFEELVRAIQTVMSNRVYLSPDIAGIMVEDFLGRKSEEDDPQPAGLTAREREVVQLVAEGHTSRQIASKLHVSEKTIETHRKNVMEKLDFHNAAELIKYAIREGLTSLEH